jgi:uncharacterized protein
MNVSTIIARNLGLKERDVYATIQLLNEGATIPFISRYRKERTGGLDEVEIGKIQEAHRSHLELEKRREYVLSSMEELGVLTSELKEQVLACYTLTALEDVYLPYKPKRKTRAEAARKLGLEPLAGILMKQEHRDAEQLAQRFVRGEVRDVESALAGARDIMAEWISERTAVRDIVRKHFFHSASIRSKVVKGKDDSESKFRDYFDFDQPLKKCPGHRFLAMKRAEDEGVIRLSITPPRVEGIERVERYFIRHDGPASEQIKLAISDAYKRLLEPAIETEFRNETKEKADAEAIQVFAENLRQLLLAPPLGSKRILAIDPGFRTGCKVVCLDAQGALLHNETIYPHPPQNETSRAAAKISNLVQTYKIDAIAIGNGTAGRETERFVQKVHLPKGTEAYVVSENGASIYSASAVARAEFPDYDVTVRGSVSIGRRLMDPLSELVKIDPKSIGVGQYQHDVDQKKLKEKLDITVESVVNNVGVNLNTSSEHLLQYVSGVGPKLSQAIVNYRNENGPFESRKELMKVAGLGSKAFEQCAGFLRIPSGTNPLDNSAVHPESYTVVSQMAKDANCKVEELVGDKERIAALELDKYVTTDVGLPTLNDIAAELQKPGRDPRGKAKLFEFSKDVRKLDDLKIGMILPGIVTNITKFGAFVDVGVKQDGLVHVSQLADRFVSDPTEIVKLNQEVRVKVLEVDLARKRVAFTMKLGAED